ncbi:hypothetical protein ESCO_000927 [Escovopsis weberi]|uniref:Uncharacterized protein n=1 Tax=Escovopsis weberi TaxID=150374 RepID=A0A0M8N2E3_ESCWE|nr:hypothetical protein ESCO_000927 [Escovopsis weberi]
MSAFTIQPLSKPAAFFSDAKAGFSLVEGAGQTLYWKNCYVLVFRTGENKTPVAKHEVGDGQALLPVGLDAFLGGPAGKFKAMSVEQEEEAAEAAEAGEGGEKDGGKHKDEGERKAVKKRKVCSACKGRGYVEES